MKIALSVLTFFIILLTPLYPVYAYVQAKSMYRGSTDSANPKLLTLRDATSAAKLMELKERIQEKKDAFKQAIANFKDKKKAERAERISNNLEALSQRVLKAFLNILDKFSKILERAENKLASAPEGNEKSNAQSAINDAKAKIAESEQLLEELSQNDYTLEISSEATVRGEATDARNALKNDLEKAKTSLKEAKKAVIAAIRAVNAALNQGGTNGE